MNNNIKNIDDYRKNLIRIRRICFVLFPLSLIVSYLVQSYDFYFLDMLLPTVFILSAVSIFAITSTLIDEEKLKRQFLEKYEERNVLINLKSQANTGKVFVIIVLIANVFENQLFGINFQRLLNQNIFIIYLALDALFKFYYHNKL